jgi:inhibitor of cysteine peptidase
MGLSSVCAAMRAEAHVLLRERTLAMHPARTRRQSPVAQWLLVAFLLLACGSIVAFAATKVVTDKNNLGTVLIKTGDVLEVQLASNPTTGYEWSVMPQSTTLLKLTGTSETKPTQSGVGRPITQIFKFQPTGKGHGLLLLHYVRSWEKTSPDEQQFKLNVVIE